MGDKSKIEWTDATWNPVAGCSKVSPGCDNCYAIRTADWIQGMGGKGAEAYIGTTNGEGDWSGTINLLDGRLDKPLRWSKPRLIFVNSMSDLFHPDVPVDFIRKVWAVMGDPKADRHTFQILTKRPQRMSRILGGEVPLENVWLGTSIETNEYAFRADHLRDTPAHVRWLSLEPLLGPLPGLDLTGIDWVVVGGESGPGARPMHPDWVRDIRDRCVAAGVPFHFKQRGRWTWDEPTNPKYQRGTKTINAAGEFIDGHEVGDSHVWEWNKEQTGRDLDGRTWDEWPVSHNATETGKDEGC